MILSKRFLVFVAVLFVVSLFFTLSSINAVAPNSCLPQKPFFFDTSGATVANRCFGADGIVGTGDDCGCPFGKTCQQDGSCTVECSDGTPAGQCAIEQPFFCSTTGVLVADAEQCGCPASKPIALASGQCSAELTIGDAGSSDFLQGISDGLVASQTAFTDVAYGKQVPAPGCIGNEATPLTNGRAHLGTWGTTPLYLQYCQIQDHAVSPSYVIDFRTATTFNKLVLYFGFPFITDYQLDYYDATTSNWRTFFTGHTNFQLDNNPAYDTWEDYSSWSSATDTRSITYFRPRGQMGSESLSASKARYNEQTYMLIPVTIHTKTLTASKIRFRPVHWQQEAKLYSIKVYHDNAVLQLKQNDSVAQEMLYDSSGSFTSRVFFINKPADTLEYSTLSWNVTSGHRKEIATKTEVHIAPYSFHDAPYTGGSTYNRVSAINGPYYGTNGIALDANAPVSVYGQTVTYNKECLFGNNPGCVAHPSLNKQWWDEYYNEFDVKDSAGENNGGAMRNAFPVHDALRGQVGSFDGSSYIMANSSLPSLPSLSFSAWVKPTSAKQFQGIVDTLDEQAIATATCYSASVVPSGYRFGLTNTLYPEFIFATNGAYHALIGASQLSLNAWHHLVVTYDGSQARLYVDGLVVANLSTLGMAQGSLLAPTLGTYQTDCPTTGLRFTKDGLNGSIDDVRIYQTALNADQVQSLFTGQMDVQNEALVSRWAFDELAWGRYGSMKGRAVFIENGFFNGQYASAPLINRIEFDQLGDRVYKVAITPYYGPSETQPIQPYYTHTLQNAMRTHTVYDFPSVQAWGAHVAFWSYGNETTLASQSPYLYGFRFYHTTPASVALRPVSDYTLRFQLRSGASKDEVLRAEWTGPDGTAGTYFTHSGQRIPAIHAGHQYIQYKLVASTPNTTDTPLLQNVRIGYAGERAVPPVAVISTVSRTNVGQYIPFSATSSYAGSTTLQAYRWEFDDGTHKEGSLVTHAFDTPGNHWAKLSVSDSAGQVDTAWTDVDVVVYDCLEPEKYGTTDTDLFPMTDRAVSVVARDALREYADAHGIKVSAIDTPEQIYQAALDYLTKHMKYLPMPQRDSCRAIPRNAMNLPEVVLQSPQCGCPAGSSFCGVCRDYSIMFTTLVRAMGVNSKCVYSAVTANIPGNTELHAYNIVNYEGRYRIIEPQNFQITLAFSSKMLDWTSEQGVPYYLVGNLANDHFGDYASYKDSALLTGSQTKDRIFNYLGFTGLPNVTQQCITSRYTNYSSLRAQQGGWDPASLFEDVCP